MQMLFQNRSFNRLVILVFITALIILASWRLASSQGISSRLQDVYGYLADSSSRANASTDTLIQTLQERLQAFAHEPVLRLVRGLERPPAHEQQER